MCNSSNYGNIWLFSLETLRFFIQKGKKNVHESDDGVNQTTSLCADSHTLKPQFPHTTLSAAWDKASTMCWKNNKSTEGNKKTRFQKCLQRTFFHTAMIVPALKIPSHLPLALWLLQILCISAFDPGEIEDLGTLLPHPLRSQRSLLWRTRMRTRQEVRIRRTNRWRSTPNEGRSCRAVLLGSGRKSCCNLFLCRAPLA